MNRPISRRGLLGAGAGIAASAALLGSRSRTGTDAEAQSRAIGDADVTSLLPVERIGLQLYSVRDAVESLGFDKVLAALAAMGYKHVEFAGYTQGTGEITLPELRALLDRYGLKAAGSHVSPSDDASMAKILDDAEVLGIPQVGNSLPLPTGGPTVAGWKGVAAEANRYGEMAAKRGLAYYLHNHFQEFTPCTDDPSKRGHDVLLAECDPRYVFLQLDIFWAHVGAAQSGGSFDPLKDYAIPHRDRYKLFHVKDGVWDDKPAGTITDVGEGKIDYQTFFTELFKQSPDEASKHLYLWERDNAGDHPRGPLAAAQASYANMRYALTRPAPAPAADAPRDPAGTVADCTTPAGLAAALDRLRFRRTKTRRRVLTIALRLDGDARVTAKLTRGGRTLAKADRRLGEGAPKLNLPLPRSAAKGPANLTVSVTNGRGSVLTVRRRVRIPSRRARAKRG